VPRAGSAVEPRSQSDHKRSLFRDFQTASGVAWLVISAVVLVILFAPFLLSDSVITSLSPVCESKARGGPACSLCGMTTAFLLISDGRFDEAHQVNRASVPLYSGFILNELFAFLFLGSISKGGRLWRC
jgi:hypothetical protein